MMGSSISIMRWTRSAVWYGVGQQRNRAWLQARPLEEALPCFDKALAIDP
jgi:hypothetical protein